MTRVRVVSAAVLISAAFSLLPAPAQAGVREQIVSQINDVRAVNHRRHLDFSQSLSHGARAWASELVRRNLLSHSQAAIDRGEGEIIEWHTGARAMVDRTVNEWWNSIEHRRVMLGRDYRRVGAGRAVGYMGGRECTIWVVRFAR